MSNVFPFTLFVPQHFALHVSRSHSFIAGVAVKWCVAVTPASTICARRQHLSTSKRNRACILMPPARMDLHWIFVDVESGVRTVGGGPSMCSPN